MTNPDEQASAGPLSAGPITGGPILAAVRDAYTDALRPLTLGKRVVLLRLDAPADADLTWRQRTEAARISADRKYRVFRSLGLEVDHTVLPSRTSAAVLADLIETANTDPSVIGVIVQMPVTPRLRPLAQIIDPAKDLDALTPRSPWKACATADAVTRIARPFQTTQSRTTVVGARGFVGSGVARLLRNDGADPTELEIGDDLGVLRHSDIVVTSTGQPGILTAEHLHTGQTLVIDCGFVPDLHGGAVGDVDPRARHLPRHVTPVPGGIGPAEMAVLIERIADILLPPRVGNWHYLGPTLGVDLPPELSGRAAPRIPRLPITGTGQPPRSTSHSPPPARHPRPPGPHRGR